LKHFIRIEKVKGGKGGWAVEEGREEERGSRDITTTLDLCKISLETL
jgi:hypothetical protein